MEIFEFEGFIKNSRRRFAKYINNYLDGDVGDMTNSIKDMLLECGSLFEEETLKENLQEEFQVYLDSIQKGA